MPSPVPIASVAPALAARLTPAQREAVERAAHALAVALWKGGAK